MRIDGLVIVLCVLLFMAGVVWSPILINVPSAAFKWQSIKDFFEMLSFIATIGAAIYAISSFNSWHKQFHHDKSFDALEQLGASSEQLLAVGEVIYSESTFEFLRAYEVRGNFKFEELSAACDEAKRRWALIERGVKTRIEELSVFVSEDDLEQLSTAFFNLQKKHRNCREIFRAHLVRDTPIEKIEAGAYHIEWIKIMYAEVNEFRDVIRKLKKRKV